MSSTIASLSTFEYNYFSFTCQDIFDSILSHEKQCLSQLYYTAGLFMMHMYHCKASIIGFICCLVDGKGWNNLYSNHRNPFADLARPSIFKFRTLMVFNFYYSWQLVVVSNVWESEEWRENTKALLMNYDVHYFVCTAKFLNAA